MLKSWRHNFFIKNIWPEILLFCYEEFFYVFRNCLPNYNLLIIDNFCPRLISSRSAEMSKTTLGPLGGVNDGKTIEVDIQRVLTTCPICMNALKIVNQNFCLLIGWEIYIRTQSNFNYKYIICQQKLNSIYSNVSFLFHS